MLNRRQFIRAAAGAAAVSLLPAIPKTATAAEQPTAARLPRWRGFNLLEKFTSNRPGPFREEDFANIEEWGFDFVRLPLSYHCWAKPQDPLKLDENVLKEIDQAVALGKKHHVHVNINFHRAPGYCVNPPKEEPELWTDPKALDACAFHWQHFAKRYKGTPNSEVSFDLLNEPPDIPEETYAKVVRRLVAAIREEDPGRLVIADGLKWGQQPVMSLVDLGIGQSTRGYAPVQISHYKARWMQDSDKWAEPTWPLKLEKDSWDRQRLIRQNIEPWKKLAQKGVGVHVGEWGAFQYTPHKVVLAWMKDCLELWKEAGWGWSLWNLRGSFGILDSNRADVTYDQHKGRKLDRAMLELLRAG